MIEVDTLSRRYGPLLALDRVSFRVGRGEVLGFLGPNGAGKTTTMKIITGYLAPTSGEVRVSGRRVSGRDGEFRDRLGYLPESAPAYPEMRVGDYLGFVARLRGIARRERAARVDEALDRCGLGAMRGREIRALSKGYRQRVGLAQAIVHDPDVLVLDEPTSGLDPNQVVEIRALIRALGREKTIIFSSHVLAEVQAVATRVVILGRGRIVADGPPAALTGRGALRVEVDDPAAVVTLLGGVPGVSGARVVDGEVEVSAAEDVRAAVARAVVGAGHALLGLRPADDLEAVFRRLTEESR